MTATWPAHGTTNWDMVLRDYIDHAFGQIAIAVATYATPQQIAGTADATSAWQVAGNQLAQFGGGRLLGIGGQWWFDGSKMIMATPAPGSPDPRWDHVHIDLTGCRLFKTTNNGNYVIVLDRYGALGYGGGVNDFSIENGLVEGSFSDTSPAMVNLFCGNHSRNVRIRNITFRACNVQGGHTFELDGCDDVLIEDCRWYGYKPDGVSAPRTEAINTDCSVVGSGAAVAGYADGLPCKNIKVNRCTFNPWTDPATGTTWPSPPILGTHGAREGARHQDIVATGILSIDPPVDAAATGVAGDNTYMRGLIHYPGVKGLTVQMKVIATNGQGSIRCVQVETYTTGTLASSDPNAPTSGTFTVPSIAEDVDIDIEVEGFNGTASSLNPAVYVGGNSAAGGNAKNVDIRARITGVYKEAVYLWRVDTATVRLPKCDTATSGARVEFCTGVSVSGKFRNVQLPVRFRNTSLRCSAPDLTTVNDTGTNYASIVEVTSGSDSITVGTVASAGYTALYSATPVSHAEGALVGVPAPA